MTDAWSDFEDGRATLLDLSRVAEQASTALDNAGAHLPQLLAKAAGDLEYAYHTNRLTITGKHSASWAPHSPLWCTERRQGRH